MMLKQTVILALCMSSVAWAQASKAEEKANEPAAKERISEYKKDLRAARNDESNIALAITRLGEGVHHKKIVIELKRHLVSRSIYLVDAAAVCIGQYKNDPYAMGVLLDGALRNRNPKASVICLREAGNIGNRKMATKLHRFFTHKDVTVARESIEAAGKVGSKLSVDILLKLLNRLESIPEPKGNNGVGGVNDGGVGGVGGLGGGFGGVGGVGGVGGGVGGTGNVTGTGPRLGLDFSTNGTLTLSLSDPDGLTDLDPTSLRMSLDGIRLPPIILLRMMTVTQYSSTHVTLELAGLPSGFLFQLALSVKDLAGYRSGQTRTH